MVCIYVLASVAFPPFAAISRYMVMECIGSAVAEPDRCISHQSWFEVVESLCTIAGREDIYIGSTAMLCQIIGYTIDIREYLAATSLTTAIEITDHPTW